MTSSAAATRPAASPSVRPTTPPVGRPASCAPAPAPLWTRNFVAGTLLNFFIAGNYFMLMVVMTAYALNVYQAPAAVAAFCASVFIVGTLFSRFAAAPLMERFGRLPVLSVGCAAEVALTALYLLDEPIGALIGVRFLHGFAYGLASTAVATIITSVVPLERKGEGIGYFMLSSTLGSAIGPFAGIFLANHFGYGFVFAVASAVVAASLPAVLFLRPPRATRVKGSAVRTEAEMAAASDAEAGALAVGSAEGIREEAAAQLEVRATAEATEGALAEAGKGAVPCATAPSSGGAPERSSGACPTCARVSSTHLEEKVTAAVVRSPLGRFVEAGVLPISIVGGLLFFGYSSLLTFLTPYAAEIGLSRAASVFFVVYALAMFVTRPFTGRAFDRVGPPSRDGAGVSVLRCGHGAARLRCQRRDDARCGGAPRLRRGHRAVLWSGYGRARHLRRPSVRSQRHLLHAARCGRGHRSHSAGRLRPAHRLWQSLSGHGRPRPGHARPLLRRSQNRERCPIGKGMGRLRVGVSPASRCTIYG